MCEHAQKCENNAIFKQKYTLILVISLKNNYFLCFSLGKSRFPPKKFYNIGYSYSSLMLI